MFWWLLASTTANPALGAAVDLIVKHGGTAILSETPEIYGAEIFARVLAVASGEKSKSEELGYGDAEFVPWQIGATM